ncbi:hypothetical protein P3G55_23300 [Leptospira sp. 96542]|nr:hypothetical protein [Leptospira sp. 96542]
MKITHIKLETTSPIILKEREDQLLGYLAEHKIEYSITHDGIGFGTESNFELIIGIVIYMTEASLSGATWDYLKKMIEILYLKISPNQRYLTVIDAEFFKNGNPKRINLATHKNGKIVIKNKDGKAIVTINNLK